MRKTIRLGDLCSSHTCFPPRPNIQASTNVFINERGTHRKTDAWAVHCCGPACHPGNTAVGSSNVFINGKEMARFGDAINCGSTCFQGSDNVFCN